MLNISNLSKIQGGETLYSNVNLQINPGEKVGLVGPNGTGKTTLFRMIIGEEKPDTGQITFPDKFRMAYFSQNVGEMSGESAIEVVLHGDENIKVLKEKLREYENKLSDPELDPDEMNDILMKMGDVQTEFEKRGGYDLETRAEEVLTGLGVMPEDHHKQIEEFSGGWKMRIALARVLVVSPDLIIMDEPTNYLDMETILWLEKWLQDFSGAVFMTTHDRYFMNNVCKKIIEVANRRVTTFSGNYDFYEKDKDVRLNQLKSEFKKQQDSIQKDKEFIAKFKARASHAAQVQSRVKQLEKIDIVELPPEEQTIDFEFSTPPRGGDDVVVLKDLKKTWPKKDGQEQLIFNGLDTTIKRLEKLAVVGVNGAGKSTLLKTICGQTDPSGGEVVIGPSIKLGYFSQYSFDVLDPEKSVLEEVSSVLTTASDGYIRNLLAAFLFRGDDVLKKVKYLSGGEKSRLILATLLSQNNNLLVLDEPTNHLDIASREVLLKALKNYEGTIILVSHDRHFLKELAEKVYEIDKNKVTIYPGNYDYYLSKTQS
ncbi:MAG: ABC-F family ATP-binding cassette domain-containing protein [Bdellovibrionota bacterium]|nr:ABC-F family ATP-binding cassette domain-containing protein [Bdellovibrionota bacterium]